MLVLELLKALRPYLYVQKRFLWYSQGKVNSFGNLAGLGEGRSTSMDCSETCFSRTIRQIVP